jgi:hypothetical protein
MSFTPKQIWLATGCTVTLLIAFAMGHYLLGVFAGFVYAGVAGLTLFLIVRSFTAPYRFRAVLQAVALVFGLAVFLMLALPGYFFESSDLKYSLNARRSERVTQSQLRSIFHGDPRFYTLSFDCKWTKCIVVKVNGRITSENDLLILRNRISTQCADVSTRWLFWNVKIDESGVIRQGCDLELYGDPKSWSGQDW